MLVENPLQDSGENFGKRVINHGVSFGECFEGVGGKLWEMCWVRFFRNVG